MRKTFLFCVVVMLSFIIFSCGKSEDQFKKEITERVIKYNIVTDMCLNPELKEADVIKELLPFMKPGISKEAMAKSFYDKSKSEREYRSTHKNKYVEANFKESYEIQNIILNETRTEAKVTILLLIEGAKATGDYYRGYVPAKGEKVLYRFKDVPFILIEGQWYRDSDKIVNAEPI